MGRKQSDPVLAYVVAGAIIISPFVFLYNLLGTLGLSLLALAALICVVYFVKRNNHKENLSFQRLALATISTRMHPDECKSINLRLMRRDHKQAYLIRNLQIIRDSIDIALKSKKRDVAESRIKSVSDLWDEVEKDRILLSDEVFEASKVIVKNAITEFGTIFYINLAQGYLEKAAPLKTERGKAKYHMLARDMIFEGLANPASDKETLKNLLAQIPDGSQLAECG